jgi:hypothetical protein
MAACGGGSSSTDTDTDTAVDTREPADVAHGVSARELERGLMTHGGPPRPTEADCRPASPAERKDSPFGDTDPVFSCTLTLTGERARYDVQVLPNGCFVAERQRLGRAVYGCVRGS